MHTQGNLNHLNGGFVQQSSVLAMTILELSQHAGQTNHDFFVLHFQALIVELIVVQYIQCAHIQRTSM